MPMESRVSAPAPGPQSRQDTLAQTLLDIVQQLALELRPHKHSALPVTLDSALERDFGFDSLGRMERLLRLERTLGRRLSEQVLASVESPRDLLHALQDASSGTSSRTPTTLDSAVPEAASGTPTGATTLIAIL